MLSFGKDVVAAKSQDVARSNEAVVDAVDVSLNSELAVLAGLSAAALQQGKNIALYPEGGCKGRRIYESFRYGAFDISLRTGIPILPVFLHHESQDDFEWRAPQTLLHKLWHMSVTRNNRVNYYIYDAFEPRQFSDKAAYAEYAHNKYLEWQARYLD